MAPLAFEMGTNTCSCTRWTARLSPDRVPGRLAPELLEPVVVARIGGEDVDDDVEVVHEDPARLVEPLDAPREQPVALHPLVDAVVDRLGLALGVAGADDEEVGVADDV